MKFIYFVLIAAFIIAIFVWVNKLKVEKINAYSKSVEIAKQQLLLEPNISLTASDHNYRPVSREKLLAVQDGATRMEMKSTSRYRIISTSVSIPIMNGVRYRISSGSIQAQKYWQATARGRIIVTDKAFVFEGDDRNERITWTQIADVESAPDGFTLSKRSGPRRAYQVNVPDPKFAAVVELILARPE